MEHFNLAASRVSIAGFFNNWPPVATRTKNNVR